MFPKHSLNVLQILQDPRVAYWEPAKWCAKLRDLKTDTNPLLLKVGGSLLVFVIIIIITRTSNLHE